MPPVKKGDVKNVNPKKRTNRIIKKTTKSLVPTGPKMKKISPPAPGVIRIIPLGGVEEVGKNMSAIEIGNDIIVIDAGIQFPDEDSPGVDFIIADTSYLEERKNRIRALVITHGHLDHIGGIPYIINKIGNPPIYTTLLTAVIIKKRQDEFPHLPKLNIQVITDNDRLKLGQIPVSFFSPTHTIPDSIGIVVGTPFGNIIFTGDIKIETENEQPVKSEEEMYGRLAKEKTLCLIADSTNVEKPGFSRPEKEVQENIKKIIANVKGRVIVSTFASLFDRIIFIIKASEELGKKVVVEGRSMKTNVEIAKELGILKVKRDTIIGSDIMDEYPDNKIVILATGAQGDAFAALVRISSREHKNIKIRKNDTILLSSSIVPGNEKSVQKLKDNLSRQGAKILHYGIVDIHSSGHSHQDEVKWVHSILKPKFFIPVHGHHFMLKVHADIAQLMGLPEKNIIVPDNGMIIEIADRGRKIIKRPEKAGNRLVMVDGLGNDNIKEVVIRDRQMLSQDGMFVIIAIIDTSSGKVRKSPDIISRGFVYLKESQELLHHVRQLTRKTIEEGSTKMHPINFDYLKNNVREEIGKYLYQKTLKRPIILPVLIEV
ncbi:MAG TPA: ribonuclease J [Candidatus Vogelbacteria bacterium]|nr:ribonuclease J [Candidatus Vogelbacteria bacterium]